MEHFVDIAARASENCPRSHLIGVPGWPHGGILARRGQGVSTVIDKLGGATTIGGVGLSGAPGGQEREEACAKAGIAKVAAQLK